MLKAKDQQFLIVHNLSKIGLPRDRKIERIYVHCSASERGTAEVIDQWHRSRRWDGIGYHFVINNGKMTPEGGLPEGFIQLGRDVETQGAHVKSDNAHSLGICVIGSYEKFSFHTGGGEVDLYRALGLLCAHLCKHLKLPVRQVLGHREVNLVPGTEHTTKTCPGSRVDMDAVRAFITSIVNLHYSNELAYYYQRVAQFRAGAGVPQYDYLVEGSIIH